MPRRKKNVRKGAHPAGTVFFTVYRRERAQGISKKTDRAWKNWAQTRCYGAADLETGVREDKWPISVCSPQWVREHFGAGLYRISYLDGAGELVGSDDWTIETPLSEVERQQPAPEPHESRVRALASRLDGGSGGIELMLLLQDVGDRAAERAEARAMQQAERDRQYWAQQQQQMQQMMHMMQGQQRTGAPGVSDELQAREAELTRKELLFTVREELAKVRGELGAQLQAQIDALDDGPDAGTETIAEAINNMGIAGVEALGENVAPMVGDAIAKIRRNLQKKGQDASPQKISEILTAVRNAQANGGGRNGAPVAG